MGPIIGIANSDTIVASAIDRKLFSQIKAVDDVLTSKKIWLDYTLTNKPIYLVHKNATGTIDKGWSVYL